MRTIRPYNRSLAAVCFALLLAFPVSVGARRGGGAPLTQRRINEWAAALLRARYALVEETGLRRMGEPLNAYLARIAQRLPAEGETGLQHRISGYVEALAAAADSTSKARKIPALRANDAANLRDWQRVVGALALLPERVRRLRAAETPALTPGDGMPSHRFGSELIETVAVVLAAYTALRDAQP